jgi:hypothetical protein
VRLPRRAFLGSAAGLAVQSPALAGGLARTTGTGPTFSLLDGLTLAERLDVLSGRNRMDLTARFSALLTQAAAQGPGVTIDCRAWRGDVVWSANPFAEIPRLPGTLLTGAVTFRKDFAQGPIYVPSQMHWRMAGTQIRPLRPLQAIALDASPAAAMVMTWMTTVEFDGRAGSRSLTLTLDGYSRYVVPGAQIGIFAAAEYSAIDQSLSRGMTARDTRLIFADPASAGPSLGGTPGSDGSSLVFLKIGSEVLQCVVDARGRATRVTRGVQGTRPAAHAAGSRIMLMTMRRYVVTGVNGREVSLDGPLPRDFVSGRAVVGAVDARMSGDFTIDGEHQRGTTPAGVWMALSSVLGTRFSVEGAGRLMRTPHGGFMQWGCRDSRVRGALIEDCGQPDRDLGAAIWGFGGGSGNQVRFDRIRGGHIGVALDNKSYGIPYYGMIDGETGGDYRVGEMENVETSVAISGCSGNRVVIGRLNAGAAMPDFDNAVSSRQTTRAVASVGNAVVIESSPVVAEPTGRDAWRNEVTVNGRRLPQARP